MWGILGRMIAVLDYGIGNLASAQKALVAVGGDAHLVTTAEQARDASAVVLPGVGAFGACMTALRSSGLDAVVFDTVERGLPFLGVCVGMQMLYESSDETPGVPGLGILPGKIVRMSGDVKLPQMQWNRLQIEQQSYLFEGLTEESWFYFVHSYAAENTSDVLATCEYGAPVTAAAGRDNIVATQFHPEKSSSAGLRLLKNFVQKAAAA
jgi:glutamine amidotransferase